MNTLAGYTCGIVNSGLSREMKIFTLSIVFDMIALGAIPRTENISSLRDVMTEAGFEFGIRSNEKLKNALAALTAHEETKYDMLDL